MNRRRRRQANQPFSLFSFQDIMIAVMGVLILVTLLMALDLTAATASLDRAAEQAVASGPEEADREDDLAARRRLIELVREERRLRQRHQGLLSEARDVADASGGELSGEPRQIKAELDAMYAQIERLNAEVRQRKEQLHDVSEAQQALREAAGKVVALEQRAKQLAAAIEEQKRSPSLTYILQEGGDRRAILVEVSEESLGIGPAQASRSPLWLRGANRRLLLRQFEQAMRLYDPDQDYFVLLIKPSAFGPLHDGIETTARNAGFTIGRELIPEHSSVFGGDSEP
jgi:hypothetical protein